MPGSVCVSNAMLDQQHYKFYVSTARNIFYQFKTKFFFHCSFTANWPVRWLVKLLNCFKKLAVKSGIKAIPSPKLNHLLYSSLLLALVNRSVTTILKCLPVTSDIIKVQTPYKRLKSLKTASETSFVVAKFVWRVHCSLFVRIFDNV